MPVMIEFQHLVLPGANLTATEFLHLPLYSVGHSNGALLQALTGDAWKALLDLATTLPDYDQEALVSLTKFVDQLPLVLNQVAQGISEFRPAPPENLDCFKKSYNVKHTLLVKFNIDAIDETDLLEEALKPRVESMGGTLEKVLLTGTHVTPCIQEPRWQTGYMYTPADAIAQRLKTLSVNDTRVLSRTISSWFSRLEEK